MQKYLWGALKKPGKKKEKKNFSVLFIGRHEHMAFSLLICHAITSHNTAFFTLPTHNPNLDLFMFFFSCHHLNNLKA